VAKALADLASSSTMEGPRVQARFPALFGWLNDGAVGVAGMVSSAITMYKYFPEQSSKCAVDKERCTDRNSIALIFTLMQVGEIIRHRRF
jgi:hypothetical protein